MNTSNGQHIHPFIDAIPKRIKMSGPVKVPKEVSEITAKNLLIWAML